MPAASVHVFAATSCKCTSYATVDICFVCSVVVQVCAYMFMSTFSSYIGVHWCLCTYSVHICIPEQNTCVSSDYEVVTKGSNYVCQVGAAAP